MTDLIDAYLADCRARGRPKTTIRTYRDVLTMFDKRLPCGLERALEREVLAILWEVDENEEPRLLPATQQAYIAHLKAFGQWATDAKRAGVGMSYDPFAELPAVKVPRGRPRPITEQQREILLTRAREPYRTWVEIALLTGMRCCEIAGIDLDSGDVTEQRVRIRRGKGGKARTVPTAARVWELVAPMSGGRLARMPNGRPADARWISQSAAKHFKRGLKLDAVTMHRMRDTFATDLLAAGVDIRVIQELLGHESLTSTQKYTLVKTEQCEMAIRALPRRHPGPC